MRLYQWRRPPRGSGRDERSRDGGNYANVQPGAGKQTNVTQITLTDIIVMQTTGNFMDAGRSERQIRPA
jgi:hypothetical protein